MELEEEIVNEYHDPDYPEEDHSETSQIPNETDKIDKVRTIIRREFDEELKYKQSEIDEIDQRMTLARRMLHHLRVAVVEQYYLNPKLMLSETQVQEGIAEQPEPQGKAEATAILRNKQKRIHPCIRKLLGKKEVDFGEIFKFRAPRNRTKREFGDVNKKNVTISHSGTIQKSLRPGCSSQISTENEKSKDADIKLESVDSIEKTTKIPRHMEPAETKNVIKINEATRNQQKNKFRIIIGNTSKYAPASSSVDRSTHRWLLYIRGPRHAPDVSKILSHVTVKLHHTYSPHDVVHIRESPFHVSRRGWGEFPAAVELNFMEPARNPPATIAHTIALDRRYTGAQTLGAETVVDVWLYATKEMLDSVIQSPVKQNNISNESTRKESKSETNDNTNQSNESTSRNCIEKTDVRNEKNNLVTTRSKIGLKNENSTIKTVVKQEIKDESYETAISNSTSDYLLPSVPKLEPTDLDLGESIDIKTEPGLENANSLTNNLQIKSGKSRLMKCIDSNTGRVCYLKMDVDLDVKSVQSIVINDTKTQPANKNLNGCLLGINRRNLLKKSMGMSFLKPKCDTLLKNNMFHHIVNDHSYLGTNCYQNILIVDDRNSKTSHTNVKTEIGLPQKQFLVHRKELSSEMKAELQFVDASERLYGNLCLRVKKMADIRMAVAFLLKNVPLISKMAVYSKFQRSFPFTVQSHERFFEMTFVKRRNIEWSRANTIKKLLKENLSQFSQKPWSSRQILIYARLHGYYPVQQESIDDSEVKNMWLTSDDYESKNLRKKNIRTVFKDVSSINTSTKFDKDNYFVDKLGIEQGIAPKENTTSMKIESKDDRATKNYIESVTIDSDEEIEIVDLEDKKKDKHSPHKRRVMEILPIEDEDDKMRCFYIEKKCMELGIELRNEDVGNECSYSLVHMVMLSALKSFTEEIVRASLCQKKLGSLKSGQKYKFWENKYIDAPSSIELHHVYQALQQNERLHIMTKQGLATNPVEYNEEV